MKRGGLLARVVAAAGVGAGLAWFLDPTNGRRRRAQFRDKCVRAWHETQAAAERRLRDAGHRARGRALALRSALRHEVVEADVLAERVRARLGRLVRHPHLIAVTVRDGEIILEGAVLDGEVDALLAGVVEVRGVRGTVRDRLRRYRTERELPGLH